MLPGPVGASRRPRSNIAISLPNTRDYRGPPIQPSGKFIFRYLPWVVGTTILLWLFLLRSDDSPQERLRGPQHPQMQPGQVGLPYAATPTRWKTVQVVDTSPPPVPEKNRWKLPGFGGGLAKVGGALGGLGAGGKAGASTKLWDGRAEKVKAAFVHAFEGYRRYADGYDELLPVAGGKVNNFNGWSVTVFDSLDTMWLMGLRDMFRESLEVVAKTNFDLKPDEYAPFFETIIRYLGGLLSAYALSGEPVLLTRADDLARGLMPAFNSPSGLPMFAVNTKNGNTKKGWSGDVLWAEALSNQMEFKYLAHVTGRTEYYAKTDGIMQKMYNASLPKGLFPSRWDFTTGAPSNQHYSVGAFADSAYEYMLKQWLLSGRSEPKALELYLNSTNAILEHLLYLTPTRNLLYVTDMFGDNPTHTLEHLSCFLPGLFALGVMTLPDDLLSKRDRERHLWAAEGLAETCWITYADTATGLGPDEVRMQGWPKTTAQPKDAVPSREQEYLSVGGRWLDHVERWEKAGRGEGGKPPGARRVEKVSKEKREWVAKKDTYLLRPETIESFYILWKTTKDVKWRDRGWAVFESIEKHAKTKYGYASVNNVDALPVQWKDEMPSYFLAETLKYLYLLFVDEDIIPFDEWVFNTEAHPLPIFTWASWERAEYGLHLENITSTSTSNSESSSTTPPPKS